MTKKKARKRDSTDAKFVNDLVDWTPDDQTGYEQAMAAHDTLDGLAGIGARDFPDHLWIEPADWQDVARQNDRYKTWPEDFRLRYTHQGNSHECTCHALVQNMEIALARQRQSKDGISWLSPLSVYAEANPRRWGGSYMQRTLGVAMARGILPENDGPNGKGSQRAAFEHTLHQTAGHSDPWVPLQRFPTGWKHTARHFRPLEVVNVASWEQHVCLVLNGYCVSNGRYGHAIPHVQIVWRDGQLHSMYSDSYDVHRFDSVRAIKAGVGGAYSIVTTTVPDDWSKPAG